MDADAREPVVELWVVLVTPKFAESEASGRAELARQPAFHLHKTRSVGERMTGGPSVHTIAKRLPAVPLEDQRSLPC